MMESFSSKQGTVLLAVPIGGYRDMLRQVLRALGFTAIEAVNSIADAISYLETAEATPSWIVTTPHTTSDTNCLQLLSLLLQTPSLQMIKVSLFYTKDEHHCLSPGFELGLFSCHKIETRTILEVESSVKTLMNRISAYNQDPCLIAASFLRDYLKSECAYANLLSLEQNLSRLYPKMASLLINVAEAYELMSLKPDARSYLAQAKFLDPAVAPKAEAILKRLNGPGDSHLTLDKVSLAEIFQLKSCVVIDPDKSVHGPLEQSLRSIGISIVRLDTDAESAYSWIQSHGEPGMVVMEWKLGGLSSAAFIQRLRKLGYCQSPIVLLSSLIKADAKPLLQELGVTTVVDKPFTHDRFMGKLVTALRTNFLPAGQRTALRKVEECLLKGNVSDARELSRILLASPMKMPLETQDFLEARLSYAEGDFAAAHKIVARLLRETPDKLAYQDLMGKVLLKMGEFEAAVMCFKRANSVSGDNIERICGMAEAFTELGEYDIAAKSISTARAIDAQSQDVLESTIKLGLVTGNLDQAREAISAVTTSQGVLSYMNNRAVAFAKSGRHAESLNLYRDTINILPADQADTRALVLYNMGLAHVRKGDLIEAEKTLQTAAPGVAEKLKPKLDRVLTKVRSAIDTGATVVIDSSMPQATATEVKEALGPDAPVPGHACCFGLHSPAPNCKGNELPRNPPAYTRRGALQRGSTSGKKTGYTR